MSAQLCMYVCMSVRVGVGMYACMYLCMHACMHAFCMYFEVTLPSTRVSGQDLLYGF